MIFSRPARISAAIAGVAVYCGMLVPAFVRAALFCTSSELGWAGGMCGGVGIPAWFTLVPWLLGFPFFLLFLSSRLRLTRKLTSPFDRPISGGSMAALSLSLIALIFAVNSRPDWKMERAPADQASLVTSVLVAIYLLFLSMARGPDKEKAVQVGEPAPRAVMLRRSWLWAQGIFFGVGAAVVGFVDLMIQGASCRARDPQGVCDGPAYAFMGFVMIWLCVMPIYIVILWTAIGKSGAQPWPRIEPRLAIIFAACLLLLIALYEVRSTGWVGLPLALFWIAFAGWLAILQELCRRAARRQPARLEDVSGGN